MTSEQLRQTPDAWCDALGARVMDPDGWRGPDAKPWDEPITREEFDRRLIRCTIDGRGYPMHLGPSMDARQDTTGGGS